MKDLMGGGVYIWHVVYMYIVCIHLGFFYMFIVQRSRCDIADYLLCLTEQNNTSLRNSLFATNSNLLIPISLQPDGVNLWQFNQTEVIVWNI